MDGPTQTRLVLFLTVVWLIVWEGYAMFRWGDGASISMVMGRLLEADPTLFLLLTWLILHFERSVRRG